MIEHEAAQRLYDRLNQARANNSGQLGKVEWLRITAEEFKAEIDAIKNAPKAKRSRGDRDPLFDTLALCCGYNLNEISKDAGRLIGVSLASIRSVTDELTPEEIKRRVAKYQSKYRVNPTPKAVANKWATLGDGRTNDKGQPLDPYKEPKDWKAAVVAIHGEDIGGQMFEKGWFELSTNYRSEILVKMAQHAAET